MSYQHEQAPLIETGALPLFVITAAVIAIVAFIILKGRRAEPTLEEELRARFGDAAFADSQQRRMRAKGRGI